MTGINEYLTSLLPLLKTLFGKWKMARRGGGYCLEGESPSIRTSVIKAWVTYTWNALCRRWILGNEWLSHLGRWTRGCGLFSTVQKLGLNLKEKSRQKQNPTKTRACKNRDFTVSSIDYVKLHYHCIFIFIIMSLQLKEIVLIEIK